MLKTCAKCKLQKDRSFFGNNKSRKDGKNPYCKECKNLLTKEYRHKFPERDRLTYSKSYAKNKHKMRDRHKINSNNWRKLYPSAAKAHVAVRMALISGDLIIPSICQRCQKELKLYAHHPNYGYNEPLNIIWLCRSCHNFVHQEEKNVNRGTQVII